MSLHHLVTQMLILLQEVKVYKSVSIYDTLSGLIQAFRITPVTITCNVNRQGSKLTVARSKFAT